MTEYERGFIDGIKSKVSAELTPTLINVSKTMLEMLKPVLSTALENALNDNNAITDTDVQPVKRGEWKYYKNTGIFDIHKCSVCATPFELPMDIVPSSVFCFCPHCGARMIKDGDTE